jgi:hypothetical protein
MVKSQIWFKKKKKHKGELKPSLNPTQSEPTAKGELKSSSKLKNQARAKVSKGVAECRNKLSGDGVKNVSESVELVNLSESLAIQMAEVAGLIMPPPYP